MRNGWTVNEFRRSGGQPSELEFDGGFSREATASETSQERGMNLNLCFQLHVKFVIRRLRGQQGKIQSPRSPP